MSNKTQLDKMKKDDLVSMVADLQAQIKELAKPEDKPEKTNDKVSALITEINRLKAELSVARETERFVAIENLSLGRVWLYDPSSKSGRPEDREKGRLMKKTGQIEVVPAHWMSTYIFDRAPAFTMGEVRVNNEAGKKLSPHLKFEDFDLPIEFLDAAISNKEIENSVKGSSEDFYEFIEEHKDKNHLLSRIYGVIDRLAYAKPEKNRDGKVNKEKVVLEGYVDYLDKILHPEIEEEQVAEIEMR
ncbi:MAG: hypothetical protein ACW96U_00100 [Candidatus Heimdallarchaeaceae archaeon]|jgi:hypothetical protein